MDRLPPKHYFKGFFSMLLVHVLQPWLLGLQRQVMFSERNAYS